MSQQVQRHLNGRLSLRAPQTESLAKLVQAIQTAPELLTHNDRDVNAAINIKTFGLRNQPSVSQREPMGCA